MTNKKQEALIFANDRPSEIGDDLYQWASDAEDMIRRLDARIVELENENAYLNDACAELEARIFATQQDINAKDAERWRMVELISREIMIHPDKRTEPQAVAAYMRASSSGLEILSAVDAAIAAQVKQG